MKDKKKALSFVELTGIRCDVRKISIALVIQILLCIFFAFYFTSKRGVDILPVLEHLLDPIDYPPLDFFPCPQLGVYPTPTISQNCTNRTLKITQPVALKLEQLFPDERNEIPPTFFEIYEPLIFSHGNATTVTASIEWKFLVNFLPSQPLNHTSDKVLFNEFYRIAVYGTLKIVRVECRNIHGLHRAFATIVQMVQFIDNEYWIPELFIEDEPASKYRALLVDPPRVFITVAELKYTIQRMSLQKFNVLHWRLTDNENFVFKAKGLKRDNNLPTYSRQDIDEIKKYAEERGILIVPEIDFPGHTLSFQDQKVFEGPHIEAEGTMQFVNNRQMVSMVIICENQDSIPMSYTAVLRYYLQSVWDAVEKMIDDVVATFPGSRYIHLGGDEIWDICFSNAFLRRLSYFAYKENFFVYDVHTARQFFEFKLFKILAKYPNHYFIRWGDHWDFKYIPPNVIYEFWQDNAWNAMGLLQTVSDREEFIINAWQFRYYMDVITREIESGVEDVLEKFKVIVKYAAGSSERRGKKLQMVRKPKFILGASLCMWEHGFEHFMYKLWPLSLAALESMWVNRELKDEYDSMILQRALAWAAKVDQKLLPIAQGLGPYKNKWYLSSTGWANHTIDGFEYLRETFYRRRPKLRPDVFKPLTEIVLDDWSKSRRYRRRKRPARSEKSSEYYAEIKAKLLARRAERAQRYANMSLNSNTTLDLSSNSNTTEGLDFQGKLDKASKFYNELKDKLQEKKDERKREREKDFRAQDEIGGIQSRKQRHAEMHERMREFKEYENLKKGMENESKQDKNGEQNFEKKMTTEIFLLGINATVPISNIQNSENESTKYKSKVKSGINSTGKKKNEKKTNNKEQAKSGTKSEEKGNNENQSISSKVQARIDRQKSKEKEKNENESTENKAQVKLDRKSKEKEKNEDEEEKQLRQQRFEEYRKSRKEKWKNEVEKTKIKRKGTLDTTKREIETSEEKNRQERLESKRKDREEKEKQKEEKDRQKNDDEDENFDDTTTSLDPENNKVEIEK